jgi:hypothetical protein
MTENDQINKRVPVRAQKILIMVAIFLLQQRQIVSRKVEKAPRDSRDKESAASNCRTPAAERKSKDK